MNQRRITHRAAAGLLATFGLILLPTTTAHAAAATTFAFSGSSVVAGGTVDLTITPRDSGGIADWCAPSVDDSSPTSTPGFSLAGNLLSIADGTQTRFPGTYSDTGTGGAFDQSGFGSFTPDSVIAPLTITLTIPSDIAPGDYVLGTACLGPTFKSRNDNSGFTSSTLMTITAAPPAPDGGNDVETSQLPDTGISASTMVAISTVALGFVAIGVASVILRRRATAKQ